MHGFQFLLSISPGRGIPDRDQVSKHWVRTLLSSGKAAREPFPGHPSHRCICLGEQGKEERFTHSGRTQEFPEKLIHGYSQYSTKVAAVQQAQEPWSTQQDQARTLQWWEIKSSVTKLASYYAILGNWNVLGADPTQSSVLSFITLPVRTLGNAEGMHSPMSTSMSDSNKMPLHDAVNPTVVLGLYLRQFLFESL